MNEPTVVVPVKLFLEMARFYKEQPQERLNGSDYLAVTTLESRAYRKHRKHTKEPK